MPARPAPVKSLRDLPVTHVDNAPQEGPGRPAAAGERVKITAGDLVPVHDAQMQARGQNASGLDAMSIGDAYVSVAGPNAGQVVQQCRLGDGTLVGVPTSKMRRGQGDAAPRVFGGWRADFKSAREAEAAEAERKSKWTASGPGRRRLAV